MKIAHIKLYEVVVPAHAGAIESKAVNKPLHKLSIGAKAKFLKAAWLFYTGR